MGSVMVRVEFSKPLVQESLVKEVLVRAKERLLKALLQISKLSAGLQCLFVSKCALASHVIFWSKRLIPTSLLSCSVDSLERS
jgi:hypothetical protein